MKKKLTESLEDYLENIYQIIMKNNGVRVKEIAKKMNVRNSSVTVALQALSKKGYINYEPYGIISLTRKGFEYARKLTEKHRVIKQFLVNVLGIDRLTAEKTACRMEHAFEEKTFIRFMQFLKFMYVTHADTSEWIEDFRKFCSDELENDISVEKSEIYFQGITAFSMD